MSLSVAAGSGDADVSVPTTPPRFLLYIGVPSQIEDEDRRMAIRETWMHDVPSDVIVKFYVGQSNQRSKNSEMAAEKRRFGDLEVTRYEELWNNKVRKMFDAMARAVNGRESAHYFAWIEDETYVRVPALAAKLRARLAQAGSGDDDRLYGGRTRNNQSPERSRSSIYYISHDILPDPQFPVYAESVGFYMSRAVAVALLSQQNKRLMLHIDDVTVGCWLDRMRREGRFDAVVEDVGDEGIGPEGSLMVDHLDPARLKTIHGTSPVHLKDNL